MTQKASKKSLEKDKADLIAIRIKNKFYDKDSILDKVVEEIIKKEINDLK